MKNKLLICKNKITYRIVDSKKVVEKIFEVGEQILDNNIIHINEIDENEFECHKYSRFVESNINKKYVFSFIEKFSIQNKYDDLIIDIAVEENIINKLYNNERKIKEKYYTVVYNILDISTGKSIANEFMVFDSLDKNAHEIVSNRIKYEIKWNKLNKVQCMDLTKQWVFSAQAAGFFFHECIGHLLEEEQFNISGLKIGDKLINSNISIYENWKINCVVDDYNQVIKKNICIVKKGNINNILSGNYFIENSGNAYTQEPYIEPIARMNCMYVTDEKHIDNIFDDIENGIFIEEISCGEYNPLNGEIGLSINKSYKIENGKIKEAYIPLSILFNIVDLKKNDIILDNKYETIMSLCGKYGAIKKIKYIVPRMRVDWSRNGKFINDRNF